jgi:hypothetical protein
MFSKFTRPDWIRLLGALLTSSLLVAFADPIAAFLRLDNSDPHILAAMILIALFGNLAEFVARDRLSRRGSETLLRVVGVTIAIIGLAYFAWRPTSGEFFDVPQQLMDAALLFVALVAVMTVIRIFQSTAPDGDLKE